MFLWLSLTHYSQVLVHSTVVNSRLSHRYILTMTFPMPLGKFSHLLNSDLHSNPYLPHNHMHICKFYPKVLNLSSRNHNSDIVLKMDKICLPLLIQYRFPHISFLTLSEIHKTFVMQLLLRDAYSSSFLLRSNPQSLHEMAWFSRSLRLFY